MHKIEIQILIMKAALHKFRKSFRKHSFLFNPIVGAGISDAYLKQHDCTVKSIFFSYNSH